MKFRQTDGRTELMLKFRKAGTVKYEVQKERLYSNILKPEADIDLYKKLNHKQTDRVKSLLNYRKSD